MSIYDQLCSDRRWVDHRTRYIPLGQVGRPLPQPTRKQVRTAKKVGRGNRRG